MFVMVTTVSYSCNVSVVTGTPVAPHHAFKEISMIETIQDIIDTVFGAIAVVAINVVSSLQGAR